MKKFNKIDIGIRKDRLENVLSGTSRHIKIPISSIDCKNEQLIYEILTGVHHQIRFDCFENKDGFLNFSENEDHKYLSAISNFYFNKYSVDGVYFEDLSPLEHNIFESLEVNAITLRLPFTNEDLLNFQSRIR